jgi:phenylalanyl-tRNA synthetase, alpha subunit (EC 6.1.1.20)
MDMSWGDGWLEIGGCGMVHPNVLGHVNIDSENIWVLLSVLAWNGWRCCVTAWMICVCSSPTICGS